MNKWIPSQKYISGGLTGVVAYLVSAAFGMDGETAMQVATGVFALVAYLMPLSYAEVVTRYEATIRRIGEWEALPPRW